MATTPETITATDTALKLTPPDPVPTVTAEKAAGLVPVEEGVKSKLEERADYAVQQLMERDANSPEFGKVVDAITNMGAKEIREAAGQSPADLLPQVHAVAERHGIEHSTVQFEPPDAHTGHERHLHP